MPLRSYGVLVLGPPSYGCPFEEALPDLLGLSFGQRMVKFMGSL